MDNIKKVVLVVVLLLVAAAGVTFAIVRILRPGDAKPPARVTGVEVSRIDEKSLEVITLTEGEWMELGRKNQRYENPKTGEYTMLPIAICPNCKGKIPALVFPHMAKFEVRRELTENWTCPRCGKKVSGARVR